MNGGSEFVQPALAVLEQLVAVQVHLDDAGTRWRALIRPGLASHWANQCRRNAAAAQGREDCELPTSAGDVLAMRPLVLHASSKAEGESRRRVLHLVFGPRELRYGLSWHRTI